MQNLEFDFTIVSNGRATKISGKINNVQPSGYAPTFAISFTHVQYIFLRAAAMKRLVNWILSPESHFRLALALSFPLIVVLVILMITAVRWEKRSLEDIQFANLREFSASLFNHILVTEIWTHGGHGGFYVEALHHTGEQRPRTALNILGKEFVKMKTSMAPPRFSAYCSGGQRTASTSRP